LQSAHAAIAKRGLIPEGTAAAYGVSATTGKAHAPVMMMVVVMMVATLKTLK
jgi:hypothetical protein